MAKNLQILRKFFTMKGRRKKQIKKRGKKKELRRNRDNTQSQKQLLSIINIFKR